MYSRARPSSAVGHSLSRARLRIVTALGDSLPIGDSIVVAHDIAERLFVLLYSIGAGLLESAGHTGSEGQYHLLQEIEMGPFSADEILDALYGTGSDLVDSAQYGLSPCELIGIVYEGIPQPTGPVHLSRHVISDFVRTVRDVLCSAPRWSLSLSPFQVLHETYLPVLSAASVVGSDVSNALRVVARRWRSHNRSTGTFYTPEAIAREISATVLSRWANIAIGATAPDHTLTGEEPPSLWPPRPVPRTAQTELLASVTVLDPALGGGVFLEAAASWLLSLLSRSTEEMDGSLPVTILRRNLYGVDIHESAVRCSTVRLRLWALSHTQGPLPRHLPVNLAVGNSLVGRHVHSHEEQASADAMSRPLDWPRTFPHVMNRSDPGFDVVISNPPYGNVTSRCEREYISTEYPWSVSGGRTGTWNSASLFILRSKMLLNSSGQLGLLLPNSLLRTRQFAKTRHFVRDHLTLWQITDEGALFDGVTLEVVTLYASAVPSERPSSVRVLSRRPGVRRVATVSRDLLFRGNVMVIYADDVFERILSAGRTGVLSASRGRDIPRRHVSVRQSDEFPVPYASTGRSSGRYVFNNSHLNYTDWSFHDDRLLRVSFENEFLVATKNLPYPRCVVKPQGMIHGGGLVRVRHSGLPLDAYGLAVILNSRLIRNVCVQFLTNRSQLTTCLNTGMMEDLPVATPPNPKVYSLIGRALHRLARVADQAVVSSKTFGALDDLADALVYELYLSDDDRLHQLLSSYAKDGSDTADTIESVATRSDVRDAVREVVQSQRIRRCLSE